MRATSEASGADGEGDLAVSAASLRRRTREPEARRSAILAAARAAFSEHGYAKTTIREVARRAGVTHGLVMMHFSSKEKLFLAAVPGTRDLAASVAGDAETLPERVASVFVQRMEAADGADPLIALIRCAAGDQQAASRLLAAIREDRLAAYKDALAGPDAARRVALVGAYLIGITFSRYVLREGPLADMAPEDLVAYIASTLRAILFG
jgi:AcrR family transcriptional regulator